MLFNSIEFVLFLPLVFIFYWLLAGIGLKFQNVLLVTASYFFYGWWDWRFLSLIIFSSLVDYLVGLGLLKHENLKKRKLLLLISVFVNLGFLGVFKYFDFFVESFATAFTFLGYSIKPAQLNFILPVGISFYTFQTLSYSIDVYKKKCEPTKDIISFFAFVSFFPQLVAGPIERAKNLLPQFFHKRKFVYSSAVDGMRQILWGLYTKIVIADNCAVYVNDVFSNYNDYSGSTLLLGAVFFAFQIYGDFSGYSNIAIGTARLFGFNLMQNFAFPYFSRDIAEFWRRWHISLSTWFRDYVYIPIGGSHGGVGVKIRNTFIIFVISGFWHGANWTFVVWGGLNALFFLPLLLFGKNRVNTNTVAHGRVLPNLKEIFQIGTTFFITVFAWIFFRADNLVHAFSYIKCMVLSDFFTIPIFPKKLTLFLVFFILIEWFQREKQHALQIYNYQVYDIKKWSWVHPRIANWILYLLICFLIFIFQGKQQEFIYFQF